MRVSTQSIAPQPPMSRHATARDLMTPDPVSIHGGATIPEVLAFLTDTGYGAARSSTRRASPSAWSAAPTSSSMTAPGSTPEDVPPFYGETEPAAPARGGGPAGVGSPVRAADLMTPAVFAVPPDTPAQEVAREMVRQNVHRLFVVDGGVLVGVISALDLLRHFAAED